MNSILDQVGEEWKGMLALTAAFSAGASLVLMFLGFLTLPGEVANLDKRVTNIEIVLNDVRILTCVTVSKELGRPIEDCIVDPQGGSYVGQGIITGSGGPAGPPDGGGEK